MNANFTQFKGLAGFMAATLITLLSCQSGPKTGSVRTCPKGPDLPHMWVGDSTSDTDESHFLGYIPALNIKLGAGQKETDSIYYTQVEFQAMIDAFRKMGSVEFIQICPVVNPATNRLSVVYVPEDGSCEPLGYFWLPENRPTFPEQGDTLQPADFQKWQTQYINTVVNWLNPLLDSADPANYIDADMNTQLLNTMHMAHKFHDLTELYDEITRQSAGISGIEAVFAARATQLKNTQYGFSNRLYVMLEFTKDDAAHKHQKFRIDTCGRLYQRPDLPPANACPYSAKFTKRENTRRDSVLAGGNNNGQLCPPTCNP